MTITEATENIFVSDKENKLWTRKCVTRSNQKGITKSTIWRRL